jgi:nitroimidazol reductase NimA-like FMN-containing flavoprotein (pyridoxamine 5'-phosphate oxidase superfamily)
MAWELTAEEIETFLDSRPGWITLTTQSPNGYPHSVPIGYFRRGDEIYIGCRANTQKTRNIERNPKVSLLLESGATMQDIKGLMIQGDAELVLDDAERLELMRAAAAARGLSEADLPSEVTPGGAYIRVQPRRYISWDYAKR